jgi:PRTRC genetic system protein B
MTKRTKKLPKVTAEALADAAPPEAFDTTPCATLTLTRETIWLTSHDRTGAPMCTYPVTARDVAGVFNNFGADSGLLPPDVLFWQQRGSKTRLAVWLPPARRAIVLEQGRRDKRITIPMPGLILVGEGRQYAVHAALSRPLAPGEQLYHAPFSNVYASGAICTGNVAVPECSLATLGQAIGMFFESTFTNHVSTDRVRDPRPLFKFLASLTNARKFPTGKLYPSCRMVDVLRGSETRRDPVVVAGFDGPDDEADWDPAVWMGDGETEPGDNE